MTFRSVIFLCAVCAGALAVLPASGAERLVFTAHCSEPAGQEMSLGNLTSTDGRAVQRLEDGVQTGVDGFSGVTPFFYVEASRPGVMKVVWGDAVPAEIEDLVEGEVRKHEEVIAARDDRKLSTVGRYPAEVWISTFVPALGVATFTRQKLSTLGGLAELVTVSTYFAECTFTGRTDF